MQAFFLFLFSVPSFFPPSLFLFLFLGGLGPLPYAPLGSTYEIFIRRNQQFDTYEQHFKKGTGRFTRVTH